MRTTPRPDETALMQKIEAAAGVSILLGTAYVGHLPRYRGEKFEYRAYADGAQGSGLFGFTDALLDLAYELGLSDFGAEDDADEITEINFNVEAAA